MTVESKKRLYIILGGKKIVEKRNYIFLIKENEEKRKYKRKRCEDLDLLMKI